MADEYTIQGKEEVEFNAGIKTQQNVREWLDRMAAAKKLKAWKEYSECMEGCYDEVKSWLDDEEKEILKDYENENQRIRGLIEESHCISLDDLNILKDYDSNLREAAKEHRFLMPGKKDERQVGRFQR